MPKREDALDVNSGESMLAHAIGADDLTIDDVATPVARLPLTKENIAALIVTASSHPFEGSICFRATILAAYWQHTGSILVLL